MDNQHRKITGYRELTQAEIDLMNAIKAKGVELGELCEKVSALRPQAVLNPEGKPSHLATTAGLALDAEGAVWTDPRWTAIAQTHLQQGLMALTRAVARPAFF